MMRSSTEDLRITETREVLAPATLHADLPVTAAAASTVLKARAAIQALLGERDERLLVITGPCSIHDPDAARDYAARLGRALETHADDLLIVMRVYFEKPRTTVGWKGLINDPKLDGSFRINDGLHIARQLLLDLAEMGVPAGTEFLDPISPQYYADLIAWGAIGARTTESQVHRELASGLSCPIGFKNATDGGLQIAVDAIISARNPHHFLGVTKGGHAAILSTTGNPDGHIILRGGQRQPNYDAASVAAAAALLAKAGLPPRIMIDCSHANSAKNHERQVQVGHEIGIQIAAGDRRILGLMIESHLVAGRQEQAPGRPLIYGQSITDACISWTQTEALLEDLAAAARLRRDRTGEARSAG